MAPRVARAARAQGSHALRRGVTEAATPLCNRDSPIHFSSLPRSAAFCQRSSGSFARHLRTTRSSPGGVVGWIEEIAAGSLVMIAEISDAWLAPENAFVPVATS